MIRLGVRRWDEAKGRGDGMNRARGDALVYLTTSRQHHHVGSNPTKIGKKLVRFINEQKARQPFRFPLKFCWLARGFEPRDFKPSNILRILVAAGNKGCNLF